MQVARYLLSVRFHQQRLDRHLARQQVLHQTGFERSGWAADKRNSAKVTLSERASKRVLSLPWGDFCIIAKILTRLSRSSRLFVVPLALPPLARRRERSMIGRKLGDMM